MEMNVNCNGNIFEQKTSPYMVLVNLHYATRITGHETERSSINSPSIHIPNIPSKTHLKNIPNIPDIPEKIPKKCKKNVKKFQKKFRKKLKNANFLILKNTFKLVSKNV